MEGGEGEGNEIVGRGKVLTRGGKRKTGKKRPLVMKE